jgi:hypothetical protein
LSSFIIMLVLHMRSLPSTISNPSYRLYRPSFTTLLTFTFFKLAHTRSLNLPKYPLLNTWPGRFLH